MSSWRAFALTATILLGSGRAQTPDAASADPSPGLHQTLISTAAGEEDARVVRMPALFVPAGASPSPFLPPGPFRATFRGFLNLELRTRLRFSAEGRGKVRVTIAGKVVLEGGGEDLSRVSSPRARVSRGRRPFLLEYTSADTGPARLRLFWEGSEFIRQAVPPAAFDHDGASSLDRAVLARHGRELVAQRRCVSCHGGTASLPRDAMPELLLDGPSFADIGSRLHPGWMERWIRDPTGLRPSARMPSVLGEGEGAATDVRDLAAALASMGTANGAPPAPPGETLVRKGGGLFADLGCISCHLLPAAETVIDGEHGRIALRDVGRKFLSGALAEFLRKPGRHHAAIRMPDFNLSGEEAAALAAWLRSESASETWPFAGGDAGRGRRLLVEHGCVQCHGGTDLEGKVRPAPSPDKVAEGCLGPAGPAAPRFGLTPGDQAALRVFVSTDWDALRRRSLDEFAERSIAALRCTSCHAYDHQSDRWSLLSLEAAALAVAHEGPQLEQTRPQLTWVGEKLYSDWMEKLLSGRLSDPMRPWLRARMPAFPAYARELAVGLAARHGLAPGSATAEEVASETRRTGALLIGKDGFGCTACHGLEGIAPYARFEVGAVAFDFVHERIRPDFYLRWMWDPRRFDRTSRMPTYTDEDGSTQLDDILEGDGKTQFETMRLFLSTLR